MKHICEDNIKCPYCDWVDDDSFEFTEDCGIHTCGACGKDFNVERNISITYNTNRIDCEENGNEHDYQFESVIISKRKFEKGFWSVLSESEWTYHRIEMCSICDDTLYTTIQKEEYDKLID